MNQVIESYLLVYSHDFVAFTVTKYFTRHNVCYNFEF